MFSLKAQLSLIWNQFDLVLVRKDTQQHAGSDGTRQEEARDTCPPALVPQVHLDGDERLHPAEQGSQPKRHGRANIVDLLVTRQLHPRKASRHSFTSGDVIISTVRKPSLRFHPVDVRGAWYCTWKFPTRVIPKQARDMATRLLMFSQGLCTLGFNWRYLRTPMMNPKRNRGGKEQDG